MSRKTSLILTILILLLGVKNVYAVDFNTKLECSEQNINPGQTFTAVVKVNNLKGVNYRTNLLSFTINYDREVFNTLTADNINLLGNWTGLNFNNENGKILINKLGEIPQDEELMKITFTAKENIKTDTTEIKIENIEYGNSDEDLIGQDANIKLKINKNIDTTTIIIISVGGSAVGLAIGFVITKKIRKGDKIDETK